MKRLFVALFMLFTFAAAAQKQYNLDIPKPKTELQVIGKAKATQDKAMYHTKNHTVYVSERGKLFIVVLSKNGNYYKKYIN